MTSSYFIANDGVQNNNENGKYFSEPVSMQPLFNVNFPPAEKTAAEQNILPIVLPVVFSVLVISLVLFFLSFRAKHIKHKKRMNSKKEKMRQSENYMELLNKNDINVENIIYNDVKSKGETPVITIENENSFDYEQKFECDTDFTDNEIYDDSISLNAEHLTIECYDMPWDSSSALANSLLNFETDATNEIDCNASFSGEWKKRTDTEASAVYECPENLKTDYNEQYSSKKEIDYCENNLGNYESPYDMKDNNSAGYECPKDPDIPRNPYSSNEMNDYEDNIVDDYESPYFMKISNDNRLYECPENTENYCDNHFSSKGNNNNNENILDDYESPYDMKINDNRNINNNENTLDDYESPYDMKINDNTLNKKFMSECFANAPPIPLSPRPNYLDTNPPPPVPNSPRPSTVKDQVVDSSPRAPLPPSPLSSNYCSEDECDLQGCNNNKDEVEYYTSPINSNPNIDQDHDYDQVYISNRNSAVLEQLLDKNNYLKRPHRSGTNESNAYEEITFPHQRNSIEIPLPPRREAFVYDDELEMNIPIYEHALDSLKPITHSEMTNLLFSSMDTINDHDIDFIDSDSQYNALDCSIPMVDSFSTLGSSYSSSDRLSENQSIDIDEHNLKLPNEITSQCSTKLLNEGETLLFKGSNDKDDIYETVEF